MKVQLITQNIRPMGLQAESSNKYVSKVNQADSFERQNVAFKGSNVPAAFKEKVLASIAKRGEEGMDELFTDLPTARQTLTVLRDFLRESIENFWHVAEKRITYDRKSDAIDAMVQHHNEFADGVAFWEKLHQDNSKSFLLIEEINTIPEDHSDVIRPLHHITGDIGNRGIIIPKDQLEFDVDGLSREEKIRQWVERFLKD